MFQIKLFCLIGLSLTPAERIFTKLPIKTVFWIKNALVASLVVEALALSIFYADCFVCTNNFRRFNL
jgi:hypothetical protein